MNQKLTPTSTPQGGTEAPLVNGKSVVGQTKVAGKLGDKIKAAVVSNILKHLHFNINANDPRLMASALGAGGLSIAAYKYSNNASPRATAAFAALGVFGMGWWTAIEYLQSTERAKEREHELELARIKHPDCAKSNAMASLPAAEIPAEPAEDPNKEVCDYTPAKHNSAIGAGMGIEYLVNQYVRKGGFTVIYAEKGVGKSIFAYQIAMNIAEGTPCKAFPGDTSHTSQRVIYFDAEMDDGDYAERGYSAKVANLECYTRDEFDYYTSEQMLEDIERVISESPGDCTVVLDCISSYKFGASVSRPVDMKKFNRGIDIIRKRAQESNYAVSFIVVTHASKSDKDVQKGCQEFSQNATCILSLSEIEGHGDFRTIKVVRCRGKYDIPEWTVRKVPNMGNAPVHFVCEKLEDNAAVPAHAAPSLKEKGIWVLDEEETRLAKVQYVPEQHGYGMVAKTILAKRNMDPSKDNLAKMKSAVVRALKKA